MLNGTIPDGIIVLFISVILVLVIIKVLVKIEEHNEKKKLKNGEV